MLNKNVYKFNAMQRFFTIEFFVVAAFVCFGAKRVKHEAIIPLHIGLDKLKVNKQASKRLLA